MKKVVLINPPQPGSLDDHLDPPLGLMYLASSLEKRNIEVEICDLSSKKEEEWPNLIKDSDIYGITLFSASFNSSRKISELIKLRNKDSLIVAGGPHATSLPNQTLSYGKFDKVLVGEGELEFPNLVEAFYKRKSIPDIIRAKTIEDLDPLPLPARHLVDIFSFHREVEGKKVTSLITSRGCPYICNFCCKDVHGTKVRLRGVENVINEIKEVKDKYQFKSFIFYDDIFTLNRRRLYSLCDEIKDLNITFRCNGRAGINTLEDYIKLKDAGCEEIAFGIESGSQKMLNAINKKTTVKQNIETIVNAKKAGLVTKAFLMVGFPGESQETVNETKAFMDKANPDKFTVFAFVPLPGCDVWKNPKEYGVLNIAKDWDKFFNISGNYEGGYSFRTKDLDEANVKILHDDLVDYLLNRTGNFGQTGKLESYYNKLKLKK